MALISPTFTEVWAAGASIAAVLGAAVAIYQAIINRRKPQAEIANTEADTALKEAQVKQTLSKTLSSVMEDLQWANGRIHEMSKIIVKLNRQLVRLEACELENKLLGAQVERCRRAGFLGRDDSDGRGPNPAAGPEDHGL